MPPELRRGPPPPGLFVALAVSYDRAADQWHLGVAHRRDNAGVPRLLHLAWDRLLLDQPIDHWRLGWDLDYAWVELPLAPERKQVLVQACRRVARQVALEGQRVRYSVRYELGTFDARTGAWRPRARELGLTCATFVLALCRGADVELVDVPSWPPREDDRAWIAKVVSALREVDPEHAAAVEGDGLCARFRPTEVACAGLSPTLPVTFSDAVALAATLRDAHAALRRATEP